MDSIRRIVQSLRVASRSAEQRFGLSGAQIFVLQKLGEAEAASINELAARTLTHQSSVSVVVQRLVEKKLVARSASPKDGRRIELSLTPKGRELVRRSPQATQEKLIAAVEMIRRSQRKQLASMLEQLANGAIGDKLPPPLFFEESPNHPKRRSHGSRRS